MSASDCDEILRLEQLIEQKRKRLYELNGENRPMMDPEIIRVSQSLDRLITQHMIIKRNKQHKRQKD